MVVVVVREHRAEVRVRMRLGSQLWFMRRGNLKDKDVVDVIVGTFIIHSMPYFALIGYGSTHSYVSSIVVGNLGISADDTSCELFVISPLVFRRCSLEVQGYMFHADLMELSFREFDLILGMDWLVEHKVGLDCETKRVSFKVGDDVEVVMGYDAYLACVHDTKSVGSDVKEILNVNEFSDDLSGLSPDRDVKFGIELLLGTTLVSISPYHMASKELKELKLELQGSFGLMCPHGEHQFSFSRKKVDQ
ncbi:ty3-gypsy sub-class retrotransposonable element polyprotein [Gossypium australe]|uniref:Ty3-gypsy sub-class retrotransposonable element polyprotein n=1 Tax=Gossypium australe TaxID=47621 RepID=A0A5B6WG44_9ROSI|nr:ty3-gypsy sub-class retrotransposonable element polyprotein [Gossypium australe]